MTAPFLTKDSSIAFENRMEGTPFLWAGEIMFLSSHRPADTSPFLTGEVEVYDSNRALISSTPSPIKFASAIVIGPRLYIVGTYANEVFSSYSEDLLTWSAPEKLVSSIPGRSLYNTSVIERADGSFLMALETCEPGHTCFSVRFFAAPSIAGPWAETGSVFSPSAYAACPTIREVDGVIYMIYLKDFGHWASAVARSSDLVTWEISPTVVLSALGTPGEENNNSDVDLIEHNGEVRLNYAIGDQLTYSHIKFARYRGTLRQFFAEFF